MGNGSINSLMPALAYNALLIMGLAIMCKCNRNAIPSSRSQSSLQSIVVRARQSTCIDIHTTVEMHLSSLLSRLPLGDDEIHVLMNGEANDELIEWLGQTARLKVEAE